MVIIITLLQKLFPLYVIIALGYIAGRYLHVQKESIARLLIYIFTPAVMFNGVATTPLAANKLSLAFFFFSFCCLLCLIFFWLSSFIWQDSTKNLIAFSAGTANSGYFGAPVVAALFGNEAAKLVFIAILGFILFECLLGVFIVARGNYSVKESIARTFRIPSIYAFAAGLLFNLLGFHIDPTIGATLDGFTEAFSILGMMLIGLAISDLKGFTWDGPFVLFSFLAKFLAWPAFILVIILLDRNFWHFYTDEIRNIMLILAVTPIAVKTVAYATELRVQPEKAALATLLSTFFALVTIPLVVVSFHMG